MKLACKKHIVCFIEGILLRNLITEFGNYLETLIPELDYDTEEKIQLGILDWLNGNIDDKTLSLILSSVLGNKLDGILSSFIDTLEIHEEFITFINSLSYNNEICLFQDTPEPIWSRITETIQPKVSHITPYPFPEKQRKTSFIPFLAKNFKPENTIILCWNSLAATEFVVNGWNTILYIDLSRLIRELKLQGIV